MRCKSTTCLFVFVDRHRQLIATFDAQLSLSILFSSISFIYSALNESADATSAHIYPFIDLSIKRLECVTWIADTTLICTQTQLTRWLSESECVGSSEQMIDWCLIELEQNSACRLYVLRVYPSAGQWSWLSILECSQLSATISCDSLIKSNTNQRVRWRASWNRVSLKSLDRQCLQLLGNTIADNRLKIARQRTSSKRKQGQRESCYHSVCVLYLTNNI